LSKPVVTAKLKRTFHVIPKYNALGVSFLSASDRRKLLLVGEKNSPKVSLFRTADDEHVLTVNLPFGDQLSDAAWTPIKINIVYTNTLGTYVCVVSVNGGIIARTRKYAATNKPSYISVSSDNIYIALGYNGIVLSRDDGMTWTRLLPSPNSIPAYAIKVPTANHTEELWVLENQLSSVNYRLRTYKIDSQSGDILINSSRDITQFHSPANKNGVFKLVYDGDRNVYVLSMGSVKSVVVFSINRDYVCQLLLYQDAVYPIQSLAVSKQRDYLYLGMMHGYIGVYSLSYNS
jgi:hypothetical protein